MKGRTVVSCRPRSASIAVAVAMACVAAALALGSPSALAAPCPNEQLRGESSANPATGQPYSAGLPECRAYEMVSPLYKQSHDVRAITNAGLPVAPDGEATGFVSEGAFSNPENELGGFQTLNLYVSRRGASGWTTSSAFAPVTLITGGPNEVGLASDFSPDLRSEQATCGTVLVGTAGETGPLVVCVRRALGGPWVSTPSYPDAENMAVGIVNYMGASSDLSRVFIQPARPLLPFDRTTTASGGIYEIAGLGTTSPKLRLVNVEGGSEEKEWTKELVLNHKGKAQGPALGDRRNFPSIAGTDLNAISENGETVFFTATPEGSGELQSVYARIEGSTPKAHTVNVSEQCKASSCTIPGQEQCSGPCLSSVPEPPGATYQGASADGSKVFFTTAQRLLNSDTNTAADLYEYELAGNKLILISGGKAEQEVKGVVRWSPDGSHIYFVENGVLTPGDENGNHEKAEPGENLYGYDTVAHKTQFVAHLSAGGVSLLGAKGPPAVSADEERHAQITPDGRYLVFSIPGKVAKDLNKSFAQAVYRYDFQTVQLKWISHGAPGFKVESEGEKAEEKYEGEGGNATVAPLPGTTVGAQAVHGDWNRAISDNGEYIAFTTTEKLQANDVNSAADVYEWHAGTVSMISDGRDATNAVAEGFGMSSNGSDIFFVTHTPMVGQDTDVLADVYDARVGGGFPAPPVEGQCSGEVCQGPSAERLSFGSAPSSSFTAGGNLSPPGSISVAPSGPNKPSAQAQRLARALKACKKKRSRKQRARCESQARKKYAGKATKRDRRGR